MVVHATRVIDSNWPIKSLPCISVVIISILFLDNLHSYCIGTRDQCVLVPTVQWLIACKNQTVAKSWEQEWNGIQLCLQECQNSQPQYFLLLSATLSCFHTWPVESRLSTYPLHISRSFEVYLLKWTHYAGKIIFHFLFDDVLYFSNTCRPHQSLILLNHHRNMYGVMVI